MLNVYRYYNAVSFGIFYPPISLWFMRQSVTLITVVGKKIGVQTFHVINSIGYR